MDLNEVGDRDTRANHRCERQDNDPKKRACQDETGFDEDRSRGPSAFACQQARKARSAPVDFRLESGSHLLCYAKALRMPPREDGITQVSRVAHLLLISARLTSNVEESIFPFIRH